MLYVWLARMVYRNPSQTKLMGIGNDFSRNRYFPTASEKLYRLCAKYDPAR